MFFLEINKILTDIIHDNIHLSLLAKSIVDTPIFQRLRNLHQLGVCYMIFPNANNNRFEHSLGTYHLAGKVLQSLIINSDVSSINKALIRVPYIKKYLDKLYSDEDGEKEFNIKNFDKPLLDEYLIELIKIAALCHDIGHGPFSHLFDEWLHGMEDLKENKYVEHENRSIMLLKNIIDNNYLTYNKELYKLNEIIDDDAFEFIAELINPNDDTPRNFIFQIVSNSLNGLDVDKLDYLTRDSFYFGLVSPFKLSRVIENMKIINNIICFPEKITYDIYMVYRTRYDLHKKYCNHKTVICIEYMIRTIFDKLDVILDITKYLKEDNMEKFVENFINLTDHSILNTASTLLQIKYNKYTDELVEIDTIVKNINSRNLYKCVYKNLYSTDDKIEEEIKKVMDEYTIINKNKNKLIPVILKIGLQSGNKPHPFDNIYFYSKNKDPYIIPANEVTHLASSFHQEVIFYVIKTN